jgi:protein-tyrosine phosphatase
MRQVLPHLLWLGNAGDGRDFRELFGAGIEALVQLAAEEPPAPAPRDLTFCRFPLLDGPGNSTKLLRLAVGTVAGLLEQHVPTLVCCGAGLSRAPAVAACALALFQRQPPQECLRRLAEQHPADVAPALWDDLVQLLGSLRR